MLTSVQLQSLARSRFTPLAAAALLLWSFNTAKANSLVLWNRLGSSTEVLNSAVGPNLSFYGGGDIFSVPANTAYVPGVFGNAVTIGPGDYHSTDRVHNLILNNANLYVSPEHGTVEAWFKQNSQPVDYANGIYRIFDGGFGLGGGIGLESTASGLHIDANFGGTFVDVSSDISALNGTWIHVAGVWDRAGINGTADTLRLYVNGTMVASTTENDWGTTMGTRVDIAGANDNAIANAFDEDNLKLYDFAMTDFSHRFDENWVVPEPGMGAILGMGALVLFWRRRVVR